MALVQFYHLTTSPLERALPKLLEKALAAGNRVLLIDGVEERLEYLNQLLWTYDPGSFLPHGTVKEGQAELQPVLLSATQDNTNHANLLLTTDGTYVTKAEQYAKVLDMFDGRNPEAVTSARARWKQYKDAGHTLTYLRQTEQGGWEQNAAA